MILHNQSKFSESDLFPPAWAPFPLQPLARRLETCSISILACRLAQFVRFIVLLLLALSSVTASSLSAVPYGNLLREEEEEPLTEAAGRLYQHGFFVRDV